MIDPHVRIPAKFHLLNATRLTPFLNYDTTPTSRKTATQEATTLQQRPLFISSVHYDKVVYPGYLGDLRRVPWIFSDS
jgi:hypothetical protein